MSKPDFDVIVRKLLNELVCCRDPEWTDIEDLTKALEEAYQAGFDDGVEECNPHTM